MLAEEERQSIVDQEHLKLLAFAHAIDGATYAFFSVFGLFYAAMGAFMAAAFVKAPSVQGQPPPAFMGWFFGLFGLAIFGLFVAFGALKLLCARRLWLRRSRTFCIVVAALSCFAVPYGTAVGVWTFIVLARPSVARLFSSTT